MDLYDIGWRAGVEAGNMAFWKPLVPVGIGVVVCSWVGACTWCSWVCLLWSVFLYVVSSTHGAFPIPLQKHVSQESFIIIIIILVTYISRPAQDVGFLGLMLVGDHNLP